MSRSSVLRSLPKRLRKELQPQLNAIWESFTGEFSLRDEADAIHKLLSELDLNEYSYELSYQVAQQEDQRRASIKLPDKADLFDRELLGQIVIRLGDGQRIKAIEASFRHLRIRNSRQLAQIAADVGAAQVWSDLIEIVAPIMEYDPAVTLGDAWASLGRA